MSQARTTDLIAQLDIKIKECNQIIATLKGRYTMVKINADDIRNMQIKNDAHVQINRDAASSIKSVNVADMIAAEAAGMSLAEYIQANGSQSQWAERINVEQPINRNTKKG